jgi:hypothetical protein
MDKARSMLINEELCYRVWLHTADYAVLIHNDAYGIDLIF